jgi:hypothetical protein
MKTLETCGNENQYAATGFFYLGSSVITQDMKRVVKLNTTSTTQVFPQHLTCKKIIKMLIVKKFGVHFQISTAVTNKYLLVSSYVLLSNIMAVLTYKVTAVPTNYSECNKTTSPNYWHQFQALTVRSRSCREVPLAHNHVRKVWCEVAGHCDV